jgi:hypothetical protein
VLTEAGSRKARLIEVACLRNGPISPRYADLCPLQSVPRSSVPVVIPDTFRSMTRAHGLWLRDYVGNRSTKLLARYPCPAGSAGRVGARPSSSQARTNNSRVSGSSLRPSPALAGTAASGFFPQVGFKSDKRDPKGAARLRPCALDRG